MATVVHESESIVQAIAERFGRIPQWRIRKDVVQGSAQEHDVLAIHAREKRLCELVDGFLVEKPMGYEESLIAAEIIRLLGNFVSRRKLGIVAGEGGMLKLAIGLVRIPDVSFVARARLSAGKPPRNPIPKLVPNLAVEMLSTSNTRREMIRKRAEYFDAGVELAWMVDPKSRSVEVFTAPGESETFAVGQTLNGGTVLPGLKLKVGDIFAPLDGR